MKVSTRPDTRAAIIRAAERRFAARGIDGVSLREINRAAEQSNASALQYHFGDRAGLLRAIIEKHRADTEARRHALLDHYESSGSSDVRTLASALLLPLAAKLDDPDGGREYLRINAEIFSRPDFDAVAELLPPNPRSSIRRWHNLLDPMMPEEEKTLLHSRFPAMRFAFVELARRAAARPRRDDQLFVSHLTDLVTALLVVAPSTPTSQLMARRQAARKRSS
jgi:AcrR family transcriptional regulator